MSEFVRALALSELSPGQCVEVSVAGKPVALYNVGGRHLRDEQHLHPSRRPAGPGRAGRAGGAVPVARVELGRHHRREHREPRAEDPDLPGEGRGRAGPGPGRLTGPSGVQSSLLRGRRAAAPTVRTPPPPVTKPINDDDSQARPRIRPRPAPARRTGRARRRRRPRPPAPPRGRRGSALPGRGRAGHRRRGGHGQEGRARHRPHRGATSRSSRTDKPQTIASFEAVAGARPPRPRRRPPRPRISTNLDRGDRAPAARS